MARLLSLSDQSDPGDRGRMTRSPITTAVVLMRHHDVIPGFLLVIDLLALRSTRGFNVLRFAYTHHGMKSIFGPMLLYINNRSVLMNVHFVGPGSSSANGSAIREKVGTGRCAG